MTLIAAMVEKAERLPLPDFVTRSGIEFLVSRTKRRLSQADSLAEKRFAQDMQNFPVALHTEAANKQHYELPPKFFEIVLGPHRKYSCCLYDQDKLTLAQAEEYALAETIQHADVSDGQHILELGCGWGSLSLAMAEKFPHAMITAVSNSHAQRRTIEALAQQRSISNLRVITSDMNEFTTEKRFDRIVSVEMFEHMSNWRTLLERAHGWLMPDGKLFLHVFTHAHASYRFDHNDRTDWIAQHFFTGGIMPSHSLPHAFGDLFHVEQEWRWDGTHYAKTANHWLENFDANMEDIDLILKETYGADAALWRRRWRLFFLATEGLFGHENGTVWGVGHYRLQRL
ncbi:MAG: SAM-dependent methyltransferase [Beijerinckiaceae bacterium]